MDPLGDQRVLDRATEESTVRILDCYHGETIQRFCKRSNTCGRIIRVALGATSGTPWGIDY